MTADLPAYKEILVSEDAGEMRVALVEDGRLAEMYIERPGKRSYSGNIYGARSTTSCAAWTPPSWTSASRRTASCTWTRSPTPRRRARAARITQLLKPGQEILVQVTKDPWAARARA